MLKTYIKIKTYLNSFNEEGQSTAEYSLVILGAASLGALLLAWVSSTGSISGLFESVISRVTSKV